MNFYGAVFVLVIGFAAVVVAVMPYIRHRQQREDFELYLHDWAKPAAERFVPVAEVSDGPPWAITPRYVGADGAPDWTAAELDRLAARTPRPRQAVPRRARRAHRRRSVERRCSGGLPDRAENLRRTG